MNLRTLVWRELWQRPAPTVTALLAVALGVSALVAVQSLAESSEQKVAAQMRQLGANILVLPEGVNLQNYYAADMHGQTLPEEYVTLITLAQKVGVEELAPKLCVQTSAAGETVVLTGILPRAEFYRKSAWQSVDLMFDSLESPGIGRKHEGCQGRTCHVTPADPTDLTSYADTRIVHELAPDAVLLGCEVARARGWQAGATLTLLGETFQVAGILPATGTVDDGRVFAHLHTVQRLLEVGPVVNVIEVTGCCEEAASGLVSELQDLLPRAKVVTISQIVSAQVTVNRLMGRLSYVLFGILMLVGGASVASVMFANVSERRRELGTLMALGATPAMLRSLILLKASTIGLTGGLVGLTLGLIAAAIIGPYVLDVSAGLSISAGLIGTSAALLVALLASYLPARRAARLDPCVCFQEC